MQDLNELSRGQLYREGLELVDAKTIVGRPKPKKSKNKKGNNGRTNA
jgi:hypothetical protein